MNISLAILFETEGFFPKNEEGNTVLTFQNFNQVLPLLSFLFSIFSSSFGMSKFFLSGPIAFLPKNAPLGGLLSFPFLCLCTINIMFGSRIICIEHAFFTTYRRQSIYKGIPNKYTNGTHLVDVKSIDPIISPEYRLLIYLIPCVLPLIVNTTRLFFTTKGLKQCFAKYPQYFVSCCFTPFMFEGHMGGRRRNEYHIRIWKFGTLINAFYIGVLPQFILLILNSYREIPQWQFFGDSLWVKEHLYLFESNSALFNNWYGNIVYCIATCVLFSILIVLFFWSDVLFKEKGIHCTVLYVTCCPCPDPCIHYSDTNAPELMDIDSWNESLETSVPHTKLYLYRNGGEEIKWTCAKKSGSTEIIQSQVVSSQYIWPFY